MANNLTINLNDTGCADTPCTAGTFNVRAFYTEVDAGHVFGSFKSREAAEKCVLVLAGREDVVKAVIEPVVT